MVPVTPEVPVVPVTEPLPLDGAATTSTVEPTTVVGSISLKWRRWKEIGASQIVVEWVRDGAPLFLKDLFLEI